MGVIPDGSLTKTTEFSGAGVTPRVTPTPMTFGAISSPRSLAQQAPPAEDPYVNRPLSFTDCQILA